MANFDEILETIHNGVGITMQDEEQAIIVDATRKFNIPTDFNTTIAYVGDVNSQIITFQLPRHQDGHDLAACQYKKIKWGNLTSKITGSSNLIDSNNNEDTQIVIWEVPPEAFTKAGIIEFSISLYDLKGGKIVFSWNTSVCKELSVAASSEVIIDFEEIENVVPLPNKNSILFVDEASRSIVAPMGYNNNFANYGDNGTSFVYFQTKKVIRGMDLTDENTTIEINVNINGNIGHYTINTFINNYESATNDLVGFVWEVDNTITSNIFGYIGKIEISVSIINNGQKWTSATYKDLYIGESFSSYNNIFPDGVTSQKIIDGSLWDNGLVSTRVGAIVQLRQITTAAALEGTIINKNELIVYYENGIPLYLYIGTQNEQPVKDAARVYIGINAQEVIDNYFSEEIIIGGEEE